MVNNFDQIKDLLTFKDETEFYFVQIIQRKKDFKELKKRLGRNNNSRLIKAYYIYSKEQFEDYKEEMIKLAQVFNARVCINLNKRNQKDVALKVLELLVQSIRKNEYKGLSKLYSSACGKESGSDKTWIIDLDTEDLEHKDLIISNLLTCKPYNINIHAQIPTKSGIHLITSKFNREEFKKLHPKIEIHTNNPTIVYIP